MQKHEYLSREWFEAVRAIRTDYWAEHSGRPSLVVNQTITGVPSLNGGTAELHLDLGSPMFYESGHVESPDIAVTVDYQTAREIYQDNSWGLASLTQAYKDGRLQAEGDLDAVRDFWIDVIRDSDHVEVFDRIMEMTA